MSMFVYINECPSTRRMAFHLFALEMQGQEEEFVQMRREDRVAALREEVFEEGAR